MLSDRSGVDGLAMDQIDAVATSKSDDQDSGRGSLNSGSQTVICIFVPKLDVKVSNRTHRNDNNSS